MDKNFELMCVTPYVQDDAEVWVNMDQLLFLRRVSEGTELEFMNGRKMTVCETVSEILEYFISVV